MANRDLENGTITGNYRTAGIGNVYGMEVTYFEGTIRETGAPFTAYTVGGSVGVSALPGDFAVGLFTFNGPPEAFAGWAIGVSGSAYVQTQFSVTLDKGSAGYTTVMAGTGTNLSASVNFGRTFVTNPNPSPVVPLLPEMSMTAAVNGYVGSARAVGYFGRVDDGRGYRVGDEFNALDAIAEDANTYNGGRNLHNDRDSDSDRDSDRPTHTASHGPTTTTNLPSGGSTTTSTSNYSYTSGGTTTTSTTTTKVDQNGNGTHTISHSNGSSVTYTQTNGGADMPIIVDLDRDGIEMSLAYAAAFDFDGDGFREQTAWAAANDGFLVLDLNADGTRGAGDGKINQRKELVLAEWGPKGSTDLQALAIFDTGARGGNGNGYLDRNDAIWKELRIWQDLDQDGVSDPGEVKTLDAMGFTRFNLRYDGGKAYNDQSDDRSTSFSAVSANSVTTYQSGVHGVATYVRNGVTTAGGLGNVTLSYVKNGWKRVETAAGFDLVYEKGPRQRYVELTTAMSAAYTLTGTAWAGAVGDTRGNLLDGLNNAAPLRLLGMEGDDTLRGGNGADTIGGGAGADTLLGYGGDDVLFADAADIARDRASATSFVNGHDGYDQLFLGGAVGATVDLGDHNVESVTGSSGADRLSADGEAFEAVIAGGGGNDTIIGGLGSDLLSGDSGNDTMHGRDGDDDMMGGAGNDVMNGNGGDDMMNGGLGADTMHGNDGDDAMEGGNQGDIMFGDQGDDVMDGGAGDDVMDGGPGDDLLIGGAGNDTLKFWRGDDVLKGGAGNDVFLKAPDTAQYGNQPNWGWTIIQGGKGNDTVRVDGAKINYVLTKINEAQWRLSRQLDPSNKIVMDLLDVERVEYGSGTASVLSTATTRDTPDSSYLRRSINEWMGDSKPSTSDKAYWEGNVANTWMGDDYISGRSSADEVYAGQGNDTVRGSGGNDKLHGGEGRDSIDGGDGNDYIWGGSGADVLRGGDDSDWIGGEGGADLIRGGDGPDILEGHSGNDVIDGESGHDWVYGGHGDDRVYGGSGDDYVDGGYGNDQVSGGSGTDRLYGGWGNDNLFGGTGNDALYGQAGDDALSGENDNDTLDGGAGHDILAGGSGEDVLLGGEGNDKLDGGSNDDNLAGGVGDDQLRGGTGRDILTGNRGIDTFVFRRGDGIDRITDFEDGRDVIKFDPGVTFANLTFKSVTGGTELRYFDDIVTIEDVARAALTIDDFTF